MPTPVTTTRRPPSMTAASCPTVVLMLPLQYDATAACDDALRVTPCAGCTDETPVTTTRRPPSMTARASCPTVVLMLPPATTMQPLRATTARVSSPHAQDVPMPTPATTTQRPPSMTARASCPTVVLMLPPATTMQPLRATTARASSPAAPATPT